jgi:ubiquinone/menaquinone biosynthesis C-methylase UbiE
MIAPVKHISPDNFETIYTELRKWEKRIYTDKEVSQLPVVSSTHPHYKEWQLRQASSKKLIDYLKRKKQPVDILEIGCGNGWLSHKLADISGSKVIGTDINFTEVQQAARVFHYVPNLHFVYGHAESEVFEDSQFDVIIFAASIQYFPSLKEIIRKTLKLLKPHGEIHILDSPFYTLSEIDAARQRSILYYQSAGFPEMANWYFHHRLHDLEGFKYSIFYNPNTLLNKFLRNKNPFYQISIKL